MRTSDFDYELPRERIAQTPLEPRDSSRMLVLDRAAGKLTHRFFYDLPYYLKPNDLLVLNQTRVIPARLYAHKDSGGKVEVLLLRQEDGLTWECLVGGKGMRMGRRVTFEGGMQGEVVAELEGSRRLLRFNAPIQDQFDQIGEMPLPPYIHQRLEDRERYQTVYGNQLGSAAAPTAGLHFTHRLLEEVRGMGVNTAAVTLHVGLDTFAPVHEDDPRQHKIHTEWIEISPATVEAIERAKAAGGRVIAVGTTSARVLESAAAPAGSPHRARAYSGPTELFILPGYQFRVVDAMITNFHLPKSTLLMMISAFAGRERVLEAYRTAIELEYRFFSFGDAMLIL